MKKYMAIALALSLALFAGCGKDENIDDVSESSTEAVTEYADEVGLEDEEETTENIETDEAETQTSAEEQPEQKADENSESKPAENESADFASSEAYKALDALAKSAGFELSYDGSIATVTAYIDDDSALRINSDDGSFGSEWNDRCGLYDEFCSEAVRTLRNNNASDVTVHLDVVSKTDDSLYYRNENGRRVYNAYNN